MSKQKKINKNSSQPNSLEFHKKLTVLTAIVVLGILVVSLLASAIKEMTGAAVRGAQTACHDGIDNDGDGRTDYPNDPGCTSRKDTSEYGGQCDDGTDNDGDLSADYPADPGCASLTDASELSSVQCDDGVDNNDADTLADYPNDAGCASPADTSEIDGLCDDGLDNDADGKKDYPADQGCSSFADNSEEDIVACNNGLDDDSDGLIDFPSDPGCFNSTDTSEKGIHGCDDGRDNDNDGYIDYPNDPECASPTSPVEGNCQDSDGFNVLVQGTVSGSAGGIPYSHTDYCDNATFVVEYACSAGNPYWISENCAGNTTTVCSSGACI